VTQNLLTLPTLTSLTANVPWANTVSLRQVSADLASRGKVYTFCIVD
jgi:hypothetical protein